MTNHTTKHKVENYNFLQNGQNDTFYGFPTFWSYDSLVHEIQCKRILSNSFPNKPELRRISKGQLISE
jgi:hypothetical protein